MHNYRYNCPVKINGKVALIEQKPWIQNKSIRDNILFGNELIPEKYNKIIEISQLVRDLEILDGGDLTEIGEKGINLSGGQKARISIARALYSNFDIVLMDDPLSALDAHVKKKIFKQVCLEELEGKTRILVTHAIDFLDKVDRILVMDKGRIIYDGTFDQLKHIEYFQTILEHMDRDDDAESKDDGAESKDSLSLTEKPRSASVGNYLSRRGSTITNNENEEKTNVEIKMYFKYLVFNKAIF